MRKIAKKVYKYLCLKWALRGNVSFGDEFSVGIGCLITAPDRLSFGRQVTIGTHCWIACNGTVGNGVLISSHVGIVGRYDHDHEHLGTFISRAPWIYEPGSRVRGPGDMVTIQDDVWIGFGAIILSGVEVGRGAIIAAGAVVTRNVDPYAIVAGNPARRIGTRIEQEFVALHEEKIAERFL